MERGRFIVFEGGDGSGKDTQIERLRLHIETQGLLNQYVFVRDPGSTDIGQQLREIVLHDKRVARTAELLMYLAARVQLAEEKIRPAIEAGIHVVSNRFDLSTIAYQIYGRERLELLTFVKQMSEYALGGVRPDIVLLLDCPPEIALRRRAEASELDRFEQEKLAFHERVRAGYHAHLGEYAEHYIIDATQHIDKVHHDVLAALRD
ncbi:MAG: thymidylate kinase [Candidatus Parcubacteria bacterium]|jgi:dTMP kinase